MSKIPLLWSSLYKEETDISITARLKFLFSLLLSVFNVLPLVMHPICDWGPYEFRGNVKNIGTGLNCTIV